MKPHPDRFAEYVDSAADSVKKAMQEAKQASEDAHQALWHFREALQQGLLASGDVIQKLAAGLDSVGLRYVGGAVKRAGARIEHYASS